ncbi:MAG: pyridoxamine 5'-phosphate oxidase family protein [Candidatus Dormibacteraeota bacterium]|uniref:Pyridoxamine 5'-phosphate oxidase family protein n=1 Tax=Candidatus Amunia macphersoniae TaxID=3127014 RepID=A0A934KH75_9BACT|nr:pyridoxamine 5'-phosphate oxidase family protein [Candidatus Dormibacteraeota bacterium]
MPTDPNLEHGRHPERGVADGAIIRAILESQLICHVAFTVDGWPYAVPTVHALDGDHLLIHGSTLSRMLGGLAEGVPACVTVTAVDGIVAARSAFNHSINYRSAMVFGTATPIRDHDHKVSALRAIVEHVLPGRWAEVRPPTVQELRATEIVSIPLGRATAKVRGGGPVDTPADGRRQVWSGVIPVQMLLGTPTHVPDDVAKLPLPDSVASVIESTGQ